MDDIDRSDRLIVSSVKEVVIFLPSKLHRQSRRLIPFAVVGIIASLAIHSFEPALVNWGIVDKSFAGSVRLGMLEYPISAIAVPAHFLFSNHAPINGEWSGGFPKNEKVSYRVTHEPGNLNSEPRLHDLLT